MFLPEIVKVDCVPVALTNDVLHLVRLTLWFQFYTGMPAIGNKVHINLYWLLRMAVNFKVCDFYFIDLNRINGSKCYLQFKFRCINVNFKEAEFVRLCAFLFQNYSNFNRCAKMFQSFNRCKGNDV